MGDYFNNLIVRSFKPATAVQPLDAPLLPSTSVEFSDPFADPAVSIDESGPLQPDGICSPHGEQKLRQSYREEKSPGEPPAVVSDHTATTVHPAVESKTEPQPARPRSHTADRPLPSAKPFAPRPLSGEELHRAGERGQESLRPTLTTTADKAKGKELLSSAASELAKRTAPPPVISAAEQVEVVSRKKFSAAEKIAPPAPVHLPLSPSAGRQTVVERIVEPLRNRQSTPASPSTLVPKPGEERASAAVKAQPTLLKPSAPEQGSAEVSQPETVINVTIRRIEIRATPAQPSKPESRRGAPQVMTLDDYLRKRSGGKP